MRRLSVMATALCAVTITAPLAPAQTGQRFSAQGSVIYAALAGDAFTEKDGGFGVRNGIGIEAQGRFTYHAWSVGTGFQLTTHSTYGDTKTVFKRVDLIGGFIEPRYTFDVRSAHIAPYASSRLALSVMNLTVQDDFVPEGLTLKYNKPSGPTINLGGGVLIRLSSRMNLDLGITYGYTKFNTIHFELEDDETGGTFDLGEFKIGGGTNAVIRAGLAIGIK